MKSLDDVRDISVEQVEPDEKNHEWTVYVTLARTSSAGEEPPSWKRFCIKEDPDGNLVVKSTFESAPLS